MVIFHSYVKLPECIPFEKGEQSNIFLHRNGKRSPIWRPKSWPILHITHISKLQKISCPPDPVIKHCKPDKFFELNGAFDGIFSSINGASSVARFDDWRVFFGVSLLPQLVSFLPFSSCCVGLAIFLASHIYWCSWWNPHMCCLNPVNPC